MGNFTRNHFGGYDVRPKMGLWVVYDCRGKRPAPARFADGNFVVYACAFDAYVWIAFRIHRKISEVKA